MMNADEYDIEDHGDTALRELAARGLVTKAILSEGVLKAHWRDTLRGDTGFAWFYRGRRYTRGTSDRRYIEHASGEVFETLADIKADR